VNSSQYLVLKANLAVKIISFGCEDRPLSKIIFYFSFFGFGRASIFHFDLA
jgi:hypothetical protein